MDKNYKIRTIFVFLLFCSLYLILSSTLFLIQIMQNDFFKSLGVRQYNVTAQLRPSRAPIFDRTGKQYLAMNKDCFSAFLLPKQIENRKKLDDFLQKYFPKAYKQLEKSKDKHFMFVQRKLTDDQINLIKESNIADIHLLKEPNRFYPLESAGIIVGMTDIDNNGISGIELQYNKMLSGKPTTVSLEKDARFGYFHFKKETKIEGKTAKPITLTIDGDLQFLAAEELQEAACKHGAKEGAIIVMDPESGDIFSMVSYPYCNPNDTKQFNPEKSKNKLVTECYELGSVIKVFAALAALEEGFATADEPIDCKNEKTTYIDGRKINTVKAHGVISFSEVVEKSNNIGIAIVAKRVGEKLYDNYKKIGFGKKTNIAFPGEQKGFINPPHKWSRQSIISLSYGYEISATLLQLASAFCMIANDGIPVKPNIIVSSNNKTNKKEPAYSKESIETIKQILENTTLKGTAKRARIKGYRVMCKTGTANLLIDGEYVKNRNIFTCAGIVQKDNFKRVIVTFLKEVEKKNVYSATVAVPLFEKIAEKTLIHEKII